MTHTLFRNGIFGFSMLLAGASASYATTDTNIDRSVLTESEAAAVYTVLNHTGIQLAELSLIKGSSLKVRAFALQLVTDHRLQEWISQALFKGIGLQVKESELSQNIKAQNNETLSKITQAEGKEFDRAVMKAIVSIHETNLKLIHEELVTNVKNEKFQAFLTTITLTETLHLQIAKKILSSLGSAETSETFETD